MANNGITSEIAIQLSFIDIEKALEGLEAQKSLYSKLKELNKQSLSTYEKVNAFFMKSLFAIECKSIGSLIWLKNLRNFNFF